MPEYQDDVLETRRAKKEHYDDLINSGGLSASVGWPISLLRAELIIHLALADLKTKAPITRLFHLSSKVGNEYW